MTDVKVAIARRDQKRAELAELVARKEKIAGQLVLTEGQAENIRASLGRAIADQRAEATSLKGVLASARAECEGLAAAVVELASRLTVARAQVRQEERRACLAEIEWHRGECDRLAKETLAATAVLAESHARWHAHARRAQFVGQMIDVVSPTSYEGPHGYLALASGDGEGIFGVLRRHGIDQRFGGMRDLLPRVPALVEDVTSFDEGDQNDDEPGVVITAESVGSPRVDGAPGDAEDGDPDAVDGDDIPF